MNRFKNLEKFFGYTKALDVFKELLELETKLERLEYAFMNNNNVSKENGVISIPTKSDLVIAKLNLLESKQKYCTIEGIDEKIQELRSYIEENRITTCGVTSDSATPIKHPQLLNIIHTKYRDIGKDEFRAKFVLENNTELLGKINEIAKIKDIPELLSLSFTDYEKNAEVITVVVTDSEIRDVEVGFMTNHEYNAKNMIK
ncbi:MAG: hypothetical protein ACRDDY_03480 [Clostridium sp.]|uniref:hypothetical protein n=1 Tax=Clostridium sp. TaxID=1506 RepID=UPI003EE5BEA4